jgi:putative ABC transport system permease protein
MLSDLLYRLRAIVRRQASEDELDAELNFHFDRQIEKNMRAGMPREEAVRQARMTFGGIAQTKESCRRAWGTVFLETVVQDIGYGVRLLARSPGFSAAALLTLTLGIGATTAVFSLVDAVLLRPLPYRDSHRIVEVYEDHSGSGVGRKYDSDTPGGYADLKRQRQVFEDIAIGNGGGHISLYADRGGEPRSITVGHPSWNLFPMLGVHALYGRLFTQEEDSPGHENVVLLSYHLWQDRFGGDQQVLGRDIRMDHGGSVERYTVIGVMPPHFSFPDNNDDLWIPRALSQEELDVHDSHELMVMARLRSGITLARANSDLQALADQTRQLYPSERSLRSFFAETLQETYTRDSRRGIMLLMTAVVFILIIACANLANLLLSRSITRQREIGVRAALGASGARLTRQLLTESALLGIGGGVLGIGMAWTSFAFLKHFIPPDLSSTISLSLNLTVLGFALLVSLLSSLLFGLAPALRLLRGDLNSVLNEGARGYGAPLHNKFGSLLVAAEIALSLLLLVGGGLLLKSFLRLRSVDPGFRSDHVLVMGRFRRGVPNGSADFSVRMMKFDRMLENVRGLPGVKHAGFTSELPLGWPGGRSDFVPEGAAPDRARYRANERVITPGYFEALRIPLIRGRFFNQDDGQAAPPVVIINQTMARTFWPNQDPIGKHLKFEGVESKSPWAQIVGIAGDVHTWNLAIPPGPEMYFPHWQASDEDHMTLYQLAVETEGDPMHLSNALRHAIQSVDAEQPADNVYPLDDRVDGNVAPRRMQAALVGSLSMLALVIAAVGIYGVMAYLVSQRTREMGIRIALGAQRRDVVMLILSRGAKIALLGVSIGIAAAAILTRLIQSLLFEVSAADPSILAGVGGLLVIVALAACFIPARRAGSVDPVQALRAE